MAKAIEQAAAEYVDPGTLLPWPGNPRKNDRNVPNIKASITATAFGRALLARKANRMLIIGHCTLKAVLELKAEGKLAKVRGCSGGLIPVRFIDVDQAMAERMALADNRLNELSQWDEAMLLPQLELMTGDEQKLLGWTPSDLETFRKNLEASTNTGLGDDEDVIPEPPKVVVTKPGDTWLLDHHKLVCGNNMQGLTRLGLQAVHLILGDPPYGINEPTMRKTAGRSRAAQCNDFDPIIGDDTPFDPSPFLFARAILWGANHYSDRLPASSSWIVWDKRDGVLTNGNSDFEMAWSNLGGRAKMFRHVWAGMIKASEQGERRRHPTQKPVALMDWCLELAGIGKGHVVYDPFMGSGPVLLACEKVGAACAGYELDPGYCDVIVERWQRATGKKAKRVSASMAPPAPVPEVGRRRRRASAA